MGEIRILIALRNGEVRCSLILVGIMVIADGFTSNTIFDLSDTVLVAMLGTALSTVFAPTYLLAKYLFKHDEVGNGK